MNKFLKGLGKYTLEFLVGGALVLGLGSGVTYLTKADTAKKVHQYASQTQDIYGSSLLVEKDGYRGSACYNDRTKIKFQYSSDGSGMVTLIQNGRDRKIPMNSSLRTDIEKIIISQEMGEIFMQEAKFAYSPVRE